MDASPWMASPQMASPWMASSLMASPWMASPQMASPWMAGLRAALHQGHAQRSNRPPTDGFPMDGFPTDGFPMDGFPTDCFYTRRCLHTISTPDDVWHCLLAISTQDEIVCAHNLYTRWCAHNLRTTFLIEYNKCQFMLHFVSMCVPFPQLPGGKWDLVHEGVDVGVAMGPR